MSPIGWGGDESALLLNPRLPKELKRAAAAQLPMGGAFSGALWMATSGSTSSYSDSLKCAALSRSAFLASARAVNTHLTSNATDRWLNPLPTFHVGGLAIYARAYLSGATVIPFTGRWSPQSYIAELKRSSATLSSLVPTQLYDLVAEGGEAPSSLRAVIIGGGALSRELYLRAQLLGWPLLPSYGLTEAASQVATASFPIRNQEAPELQILPHLELAISSDGSSTIMLKGPSLLTHYAFVTVSSCEVVEATERGWFTTADRGVVRETALFLMGRVDDIVKIAGENVDIAALQDRLEQLRMRNGISGESVILAIDDKRKGKALHLVAAKVSSERALALIEAFNAQVLPFERISRVHYLDKIPRSPLGKVMRGKLLNYLNLSLSS